MKDIVVLIRGELIAGRLVRELDNVVIFAEPDGVERVVVKNQVVEKVANRFTVETLGDMLYEAKAKAKAGNSGAGDNAGGTN